MDLIPIGALDDNLLLPWLDLYETAFPPRERLLLSTVLTMIKSGAGDDTPQLLAAVENGGGFVGMAMISRPLNGAVTWLWFLAVEPAQRNKGLGAVLYQQILENAREAGCRALFLEVEIPELADTPEGRILAERRIAFYRRLGARRLTGIDYLQVVGWHQEPLPMYLMVQPLQELTPSQVLELAEATFGADITVSGSPGLS